MPDTLETFLDEAFLKRLEQLKMLARRSIRGQQRGDYYAMRSGASVEFLDYRKYQIGDDLRYVDWNVYGRLDKLFIKLFQAEKNQMIHILLDMSRSMGFGTPPKHRLAKKIAAAISYICLTHMNQVSLTAFADAVLSTKREAGGRQGYLPLLNYLLTLEPGNRTQVNNSLSHYAATSSQPGVAVIISDLLDPDGFERGVKALRFARFDISIVQLLDHQELFPALNGHLILEDVESGRTKRLIIDRELLKRYQAKIEGFIDRNREICRQNGIDFHIYDTLLPFEDFLIRYVTEGALFR